MTSSGPFNEGREVVYLFEGSAAGKAGLYERSNRAFNASLSINPDYSRPYIGLGNSAYALSLNEATSKKFEPDPQLLARALEYYNSALNAKIQPKSADIPG